ncbi:MAG: HupE/UreJ family protein [Oscillatoriales cyanobacterium SM2_2_1]|nr:HupE/UreJ family protein [Oscillatoriales cyanobacterium SM2_2_1]
MLIGVRRRAYLALVCLSAALLPTIAQAHPEEDGVANLASGFFHTLGGLDHILAMVAIGIWAAQMGGKGRWLVPTAFVVLMVVGGVLGIVVPGVPLIEQGIMASIFVLGALIAGARPLPFRAGALIAGGLALFHGYAHGVEMPAVGSAWEYGFGFLLGTMVLHTAGLGGTLALQKMIQPTIARVLGVGVLLGGVYVVITKMGAL